MLSCKKCYYSDRCTGGRVCGYYDPVDHIDDNERLSELVENSRDEYRAAWFEYISEYND